MDLLEAEQRGFDNTTRHPWELARLEVVRQLIGRYVTLPPGAVILDVGCGDTFVVEQLAAQYPDVQFHAVDTAFTEPVMNLLRGRLRGGNVFVASSLDGVNVPAGASVALVILMDVLEHIEDDGHFLEDLLARPYMGSGAHLLATVPAYQALFCGHDAVLGHYRRYSCGQLRTLLHGSGLRMLDSGYFFFTLLPVRFAAVVRERLLGRDRIDATGLVTWHGSPTRTRLLTQLLTLDARLCGFLNRIGITMPGLSGFAVCRKSA